MTLRGRRDSTGTDTTLPGPFGQASPHRCPSGLPVYLGALLSFDLKLCLFTAPPHLFSFPEMPCHLFGPHPKLQGQLTVTLIPAPVCLLPHPEKGRKKSELFLPVCSC